MQRAQSDVVADHPRFSLVDLQLDLRLALDLRHVRLDPAHRHRGVAFDDRIEVTLRGRMLIDSHAHLDAEDGDGMLLSIDDEGVPQEANIERYLDADLLDDYGFSEWVGPEPHGLGKHNTGTVKDPFTASETIDLLGRLDADEDERPWLTVCSFLNPHDVAFFGLIGFAQGLRFGDVQNDYHQSLVFTYLFLD